MSKAYTIIFAVLLLLGLWGYESYLTRQQWNSLTFWKTATPAEVKQVIAAGFDINCMFENGHTPLTMASFFNDSPEVIELLIGAGASLDLAGCGQSPLMTAASHNPNPEICKVLIRHGANVNIRGINGLTPILAAAGSNQNVAVFSLLVEAGADLSERLESGESVADLATKNRQAGVKISEYLDSLKSQASGK